MTARGEPGIRGVVGAASEPTDGEPRALAVERGVGGMLVVCGTADVRAGTSYPSSLLDCSFLLITEKWRN